MEVSHAVPDELISKLNLALGKCSPLLGPEGNPMKTSVCDQIQESMKRGADIEEQLANSKVNNVKKIS